MKIIAALLTALLAAPGAGQQLPSQDAGGPAGPSSAPGQNPRLLDSTWPNIYLQWQEGSAKPVSTPQEDEQARTRRLERTRLAGGATAVAGTGLFSYWVVAGIGGPMALTAAAIFIAGATAYLAHRRLKGHGDLVPRPSPPRGA